MPFWYALLWPTATTKHNIFSSSSVPFLWESYSFIHLWYHIKAIAKCIVSPTLSIEGSGLNFCVHMIRFLTFGCHKLLLAFTMCTIVESLFSWACGQLRECLRSKATKPLVCHLTREILHAIANGHTRVFLLVAQKREVHLHKDEYSNCWPLHEL